MILTPIDRPELATETLGGPSQNLSERPATDSDLIVPVDSSRKGSSERSVQPFPSGGNSELVGVYKGVDPSNTFANVPTFNLSERDFGPLSYIVTKNANCSSLVSIKFTLKMKCAYKAGASKLPETLNREARRPQIYYSHISV